MTQDIQIEYTQAQEVARQFGAAASRVRSIARCIVDQVENLQSGGWISDSARVFYNDMQDDLLPGFGRLVAALDESSVTVGQIIAIMQAAEEAAAALFADEGGAGVGDVGAALAGKARVLAEYAASPLPRAISLLQQRRAGEQIIERFRQEGLCLVLPDGTRLGDPAGEEVRIEYADIDPDGSQVAAAQFDDARGVIVIDPDFDGSDVELAATIAHEMVHAVDAKDGRLRPDTTLESWDLSTENLSNPEYVAELENQLSWEMTMLADSEVRAYGMTAAVYNNTVYRDDGVTTASEFELVLDTLQYEEQFELHYSKVLTERTGVPVGVDVIRVGSRIEVRVIPIPPGGGGSAGAF